MHFDLDDLGDGKKLPFEDGTFDSATFVSSWQYLKHPKEVVTELRRLLKPSAEVYIVTGQSAGLDGYMTSSTRTNVIQEFFASLGYDTVVENIPISDGNVDEFQSLCVGMPERNKVSKIKNKKARLRANEQILQNPSIFDDNYVDDELVTVSNRLSALSEFPITEHSRNLSHIIESMSQDYCRETHDIPLVFAERTTQVEFSMLTKDAKQPFATLTFVGEGQKDSLQRYNFERRLKDLQFFFARSSNYFQPSTPGEELIDLVRFIEAVGLNSFTRSLQEQTYEVLRQTAPNLDELTAEQRSLAFHLPTCEFKQRRKVDELIERKSRINKEGVPVAGTGTINLNSVLPNLRQFVK